MIKPAFTFVALLFSAHVAAATLPNIHNGQLVPPALPTQVLECNLPISPIPTSNITSFSNCIQNNVTDYADEVRDEATDALNDTIEDLEARINGILPPDVMSCLAQLNTSVGTSINQAQNNPTGFATARIQSVRNSVAANAQNLFNVSLSNPETPQQRVVRFRQALLNGLGNDPVASCMVDLPPAVLQQMTNVAQQQAEQLHEQMESLYRQHFERKVYQLVNSELIPALQSLKQGLQGKAIQGARIAGRSTRQAATLIPVPEDIELLAIGLLAERALNPRRLSKLASSIDQYANTQSPSSSQQAALQRELTSIQSFADEIAIELGIRVVRMYSHDVIDAVGEPGVEFALEYVRGFKTVVYEVIDVPCSTGVYASEAVCSVVQGVAGIVVDFAMWGLKKAIVEGMHEGFDQMLDAHQTALLSVGSPVKRAKNSSLLAPVAQHLPTEDELVQLLIPQVRDLAQGMRTYHRAVSKLAASHAVSPSPRTTLRRK